MMLIIHIQLMFRNLEQNGYYFHSLGVSMITEKEEII